MKKAPLRSALLPTLAIFAFTLSFDLAAQAGRENRVALIIGNSDYPNVPLKNPGNDAADLAARLKSLGFSTSLLLNADLAAMNKGLRDFGNAIKEPGSTALFYYSGHGVQYRGANYLIPAKADIQDPDELPYASFNVEQVYAKMESAKAATSLVILDACRNNPFPGAERAMERGLAVVGTVQPPQAIIVYATAPGKTAQDGEGRNGVFTAALLKHLSEPGLDVELMLRRVREEVLSQTQGAQVPWHNSSLTRGFSFTGGGRLKIVADREGAEILIDGVTRGTAPLSLSDLPRFKTLNVTARLPGYQGNAEMRLEDFQERELAIRLDPIAAAGAADPRAKGRLVITSDRPGITVRVNEEEHLTPATLDLDPGTYGIQVQESQAEDGLIVLEQPLQWLNLGPGAVMSIPVKTIPARAFLSTRHLPKEAVLEFRGEEMGSLPLYKSRIEAGDYEAVVRLPGKAPLVFRGTALPEQESLIEFGWRKDAPIRLARRTLKVEAKPEAWEGLDPVSLEAMSGYGILADKGYAITALYLARDDKYLYWRVDFSERNPFVDRPKGIKKALSLRLNIDLAPGRQLYFVYRLLSDGKTSGFAGIWNQATQTYTSLGDDILSAKNDGAMFMARCPLSQAGKHLAEPYPTTVILFHEGPERWEPGEIRSLPRFVDFR